MCKFSFQNKIRLKSIFLIILFTFCNLQKLKAEFIPFHSAVVESIIDDQKLYALSEQDDWEVGEILPIISKNAKLGVIAFVEVFSITKLKDNNYQIKLKLLKQSRKYLIQLGDVIRRMDLSAGNDDYIGSTDLIIRESQMNISSRYRPLVTQGFAIGETAQTLFEKEVLVNYFGNAFYGFNDWLTLGSTVPANFLGRPNLNFKARLYNSESTTLASGLSFVRLVKENQATLNFNLFWDSISSDSLITHTFLGLGLISWDGAADLAAIKALGSSSFQTGYEIILNNWDRFLIGPNYNFEKKALGGYLSYVWLMNRMHFQISLNATDITHFRLDPTDGYFGFFDLYWRF